LTEKFVGKSMSTKLTKESTIKKTYGSENLPSPLFAKEGIIPPFCKGRRRDLLLGVSI
jgi:hypothetical protein